MKKLYTGPFAVIGTGTIITPGDTVMWGDLECTVVFIRNPRGVYNDQRIKIEWNGLERERFSALIDPQELWQVDK